MLPCGGNVSNDRVYDMVLHVPVTAYEALSLAALVTVAMRPIEFQAGSNSSYRKWKSLEESS